MKADLYTKVVLTVVALALALVLIACNQYVHPATTAQAQGVFAGVQFSGPAYSFFDSRTGDVYKYYSGGTIPDHMRLTRLGQPAAVLK